MISEPNTSERKSGISYEQGQVLINKVLDALEVKENMDKVLGEEKINQDKVNGKGNYHKLMKKERIKAICKIADVDYDDYLKALRTSKNGYKVVLERDVDELFTNPFK